MENSKAFSFRQDSVYKEQITLIENDKIIPEDSDFPQTLNSFFSSIVTNLKILEYTDNNSNSENITNPTIKVVLKYRNYPSILTLGEVCKERSISPFSFLGECKEEILKDILNFRTSRTCQETDFPTKVI